MPESQELFAGLGGGGGEDTTPPLCNLTQMTLMQVVHTETYLHRWEPLRDYNNNKYTITTQKYYNYR